MAILSRHKRALKPTKTEVGTFARLHKVCPSKRSITVLCGDKSERPFTVDDDDDTQEPCNIVKVTSIDANTSEKLGHLLPNITSLEVIIDGSQRYEITDIANLIGQWSHKLVNLKLKCFSKHYPDNRNGQIKQLLLSLNSITTLRALSINSLSWWFVVEQDPIYLPILAKLKSFDFFTSEFYDYENLRQSLVRYAGPNRNLKQIGLTLVWHKHFPAQEHPILAKLTKLILGAAYRLTRDQWAHLANVSTVIVFISGRAQFMDVMAGMQWSKVCHLVLIIWNKRAFAEEPVPIELPQLPAVTNLKLQMSVAHSPTTVFKSLKLGTIFPNLVSVNLNISPDHKTTSSICKWMAKIWCQFDIRMFKLRVRRQLPGVKCNVKIYD